MASTAIKDAEMMEERYDSDEVLAQKVDALADMVRDSKHFVAFTGAGISTSAGIPDFRGPEGKWTREAKGLKPLQGVSVVGAYPTPTHMAFVELYRRGVLKYLISQNCDGMHRRSGLPASAISELHGNCWVEICEDCGQQYFRDFKCDRLVRKGGAQRPADHFTGRFCSCGGRLLNSTIDFGQHLPQKPLEHAQKHSRRADLHLACGSSLRVSPACDQPASTVQKGGKLVICNLQKTPLTNMATMQIYAKTDTVMAMLMERLSIPIPPFRLLRRIVVGRCAQGGMVYAKAIDLHDPTLEMQHICAIDWDGNGPVQQQLETHRFKVGSNVHNLSPKLHFVGHYREPPLELKVDLSNAPAVDTILSFDPYECAWTLLSQVDVPDGELQAPCDAIEARIPDYGQSHRQYCIDKVMEHRNCDLKTAQETISKRIDASIRQAVAEPPQC
jgi:mono-ADP-ribosyltransferase sirtuin 6